ncbi:hypothetical protein LguiB_024467 [Lonicera macranthoides]
MFSFATKHQKLQLIMVVMDWSSWLSKTGLDSSLIYEYGRAFTRNELQLEDVAHFNHEFLQSMGISVAKHRLEILKLAQKEYRGSSKSLLRLVSAINKTRRALTKNIGKWAFSKDSALSDLNPYRSQWTGALRKQSGSTGRQEDKLTVPNRSTMRSGPLDRREQDRLMVASRYVSVSGPLDGKMQERMLLTKWSPTISRPMDGRLKDRVGFPNRSPREYGPLDGLGLSPKMDVENRVPSLWSLMFQDMKPT